MAPHIAGIGLRVVSTCRPGGRLKVRKVGFADQALDNPKSRGAFTSCDRSTGYRLQIVGRIFLRRPLDVEEPRTPPVPVAEVAHAGDARSSLHPARRPQGDERQPLAH